MPCEYSSHAAFSRKEFETLINFEFSDYWLVEVRSVENHAHQNIAKACCFDEHAQKETGNGTGNPAR